MDRLLKCGINLDQTPSEFERGIAGTLTDDTIIHVRDSLFLEALEADLATSSAKKKDQWREIRESKACHRYLAVGALY